jgi:hypothetical protein
MARDAGHGPKFAASARGSGFLGHDLAVTPDVDGCSVESGGPAGISRGTAQGPTNPDGKVLGLPAIASVCLHGPFSSSRPEPFGPAMTMQSGWRCA